MLVDRVDTGMVRFLAESVLDPDDATIEDGPSTRKHIVTLQPAEGLTWRDVGHADHVTITIEPSTPERLRELRSRATGPLSDD
jgi:hypothetical protein